MGTGPIANVSAIGADLPSQGNGEASAPDVMSAIPAVERHLATALHREPKLTDAGLLSGAADGCPGGRHGSEADAPFGATRQGPRPVPSRSCRLTDKGPRPGSGDGVPHGRKGAKADRPVRMDMRRAASQLPPYRGGIRNPAWRNCQIPHLSICEATGTIIRPNRCHLAHPAQTELLACS
ncbi:hypothetical protein JCM16408A_36980 [Methylobacterium phyllosphaerae]